MRLPVLAAIAALLTLACATSQRGSSGKPIQEFPSPAKLNQLAASTATTPALNPNMATVDTWSVAAEASTVAEAPYPSDTAWDSTFRDVASATGATPTVAMRCLAQEIARVTLAMGRGPDLGLSRFLAARCGSLVTFPQTFVWQPEVPPELDTGAAFAAWRAGLREELAQQLRGEDVHAGFALHRDGEKVVMVLAKGTPETQLQSFSRVVDNASTLTLRGRLRKPAVALLAHVNHGAYGVRNCEVDPAFALPDFRVTCTIAEGDDHAWIDVSVLPPGKVLAHAVLSVLALRHEGAALTYTRREIGAPRPVKDEASFRSAVLELVNGVRAQAGMAPVSLADQQSATASSLTLPFFNAFLGEEQKNTELVNLISLGLMAGWDVKGGIIRDANLAVEVHMAAPDASRWLSDALEVPAGRLVLLDPEADVLALGARVQESPGLVATLAVSYRFHTPETKPGERAGEILERLARIRKARGLGATVQVTDLPGIPNALADIEAGKSSPHDAMDDAMTHVANSMQRSVRGLVWETNDLEAIEFPPELLERGDLYLGAGVTFYKPPGAAWGQYAVLFVVLNMAGGQV